MCAAKKNNLNPSVFVRYGKYVCDTCEPLKRGIARKTIKWTGIKRGLYPGTPFESDELGGLRLLAYWDSKQNQDWSLGYHRNEGLEIGFVEKGETEFSTNKKKNSYDNITSKHVTITKPWQEHSIGNPFLGVCKMYFVIIDFGVRKPNQKWEWPDWIVLGQNDKKFFSEYMQRSDAAIFRSTLETKNAFSRIGKILSNTSGLDISAVAININTILYELVKSFKSSVCKYDNFTTSEKVVKCFIDQLPDFCGEPWTINLMAEDCGLKPTRFSYYCKKLTNLSPVEILTDVRLKQAKKLIELHGADKSILDIALECGFSSSQYFPTVFRNKFGKSPSCFRSP